MNKKKLGLLLVALAMATPSAGAAIISRTYDFSATDFFVVAGSTSEPTVDPVVGRLSITFDSSADISDSANGTTDGFVLHSINIPVAPSGYSYLAERDMMVIGGLNFGVGAVGLDQNDWVITILDFSSSPNGVGFAFAPASAGDPPAWHTFLVTVTRVAPVAEPGTLALLGLGLAGLSLSRRRKA